VADRHGPRRATRFIVEISDTVGAGFSRCRLASSSADVVEYREGNESPTPRKLTGLNRFGPLVLEGGVTTDSVALFEWHLMVVEENVDDARRDVAVVLLDQEGEPAGRWELIRAWPARYEGPILDASRSAVAVETLEIVCEGVRRVDGG
jgi:phage tail-like protein